MSRLQTWMAVPVLLLAVPSWAQDKDKTVYCWNEDGRKVCGDALPANAVDNARTEIDAGSGMTTRTLEEAPTDAERAAAEAQARIEKQQAREAAAKARREMAMVESYATEAELRGAFKHRLVLLEEAVETSQMSVVGMRRSLVSQLRLASEAELAGKPIRKPLAANIRAQHKALLQQQQLLVEQRHELAALDEELTEAVQRYRELKSPTPEHREG